jgi:hypothetical protein
VRHDPAARRPGVDGWQELGNVIVVTAPERHYVEAAFGLESLAASAFGGDLYALSEIASGVAVLAGRGYSPDHAANLVNMHREVARREQSHVRRVLAAEAFVRRMASRGGTDAHTLRSTFGLGPDEAKHLLAGRSQDSSATNRSSRAASAGIGRTPP